MVNEGITQVCSLNITKIMLKISTCIVVPLLMISLLMTHYSYAQADTNSSFSLKQLLLMPDDLTQPHAKFESDCQQCHLHFEKENQSPLCLDCHKEINKDLKNDKGFHSKIAKDSIKQCSVCHTDHRGRDFNITSLDKDHFDHNKTEFELHDSHMQLECDNCHKPTDKNFRIKLKKGKCSSCHEDPHQEKLGDNCTQCHDEKQWKTTSFNHDKTDFMLENKHEELSCKSCHVNDVAVEIGSKCSNCHLSRDKHLDTFGSKCQTCHTTKTWEKTDYDHFKETKFRLQGKHKELNCDTCHLTIHNSDKRKKLGTTCFECHQNDDVHLTNNGQQCEDCHNNSNWSETNFDHNSETTFKLDGSHKQLSCDVCHLSDQILKNSKTTLTKKEKTHTLKSARTCFDCHEIIDAHQGSLGKECQSCHHQQKWHEQVVFNHDFTLFPLTGAHQLQVCQSCHFSNDFVIEKFSCISCHEADDIHHTSLGEKCVSCHNSASWSAWTFDHTEQTQYPLEGAHNNLSCNSCHIASLVKPIFPPKQCAVCHKSDDVHQGDFGNRCQQCHNTDSFYDFKH